MAGFGFASSATAANHDIDTHRANANIATLRLIVFSKNKASR